MASIHRLTQVAISTALLASSLACYRDEWGQSHAHGTKLGAARPECPQVWSTFPITAPRGPNVALRIPSAVTIGASGLEVSGPITNIPEFHDCQRFLVAVDGSPPDSVRYDSLFAIFAAFKLDSIVEALEYGVVTWSSSDAARVTVSATGVVTAVALGSATITVLSAADASVIAHASVTVLSGAGSGSAGTDTLSQGQPAIIELQVGEFITLVLPAAPVTRPKMPVAQIYSYGSAYPDLGIAPNFNCLYLYVDTEHTLRAKMIPAPNLGSGYDDCFGAFDPRTSAGKELSITRQTGGSFKDYPAVARWDWDPQNRKQYIGIKCGAAWCEIGRQEGFASSQSYASTATGTAVEKRVTSIKGWYDEQRLAIQEGTNTATPSRAVATVIPHPDLDSYDSARYAKSDWLPVSYVAFQAEASDPVIKHYKNKLNIEPVAPQVRLSQMNQLFLCYGTRGDCEVPNSVGSPKCGPDRVNFFWTYRRWWSKIVSTTGAVAYRCVTRRDHKDAPSTIETPGTARWRWVVNDETIWESCAVGCCEVDTRIAGGSQ